MFIILDYSVYKIKLEYESNRITWYKVQATNLQKQTVIEKPSVNHKILYELITGMISLNKKNIQYKKIDNKTHFYIQSNYLQLTFEYGINISSNFCTYDKLILFKRIYILTIKLGFWSRKINFCHFQFCSIVSNATVILSSPFRFRRWFSEVQSWVNIGQILKKKLRSCKTHRRKTFLKVGLVKQ